MRLAQRRFRMCLVNKAILFGPRCRKWGRYCWRGCSIGTVYRKAFWHWCSRLRTTMAFCARHQRCPGYAAVCRRQRQTIQTRYGNISAASIGSIQRGILAIQQQGGEKLFSEPALNLDDLMQTDADGHGLINVLVADKLIQSPKLYATVFCGCLLRCLKSFRK